MSERIGHQPSISILTEDLLLSALDEESRINSVNYSLLIDPSRRFIVFANGLLITSYNKVVGLALEDVYDEGGKLKFERGRFYTPVNEQELLRSMFGIDTPDRSPRSLHQSLRGEWIPNRQITERKGLDTDTYLQGVTSKLHSLLNGT